MAENKIIDGRNTFCPGPLMELIAGMKQASVGDVLELLSTDDGSAADVPAWVSKIGYELLGHEKVEGVWHIKVRKTK